MKSVTDVARIADPIERLTEAAELVRKATAKAEHLRYRRDLAILVLLRPFADAVASTNAARAELRDRLEADEITDAEYNAGLAANRAQRQADLEAADVKVYPVHVYQMLGVSRGLVNRILMRMPNGPLPTMTDPRRVAREAHAKIPEIEQVITDAREIRDTALLNLMSGEATDASGKAILRTNADIARATKLTTARVAQLREGAR